MPWRFISAKKLPKYNGGLGIGLKFNIKNMLKISQTPAISRYFLFTQFQQDDT
jgi:hypothetical protein